jgi:hypothetical protein
MAFFFMRIVFHLGRWSCRLRRGRGGGGTLLGRQCIVRPLTPSVVVVRSQEGKRNPNPGVPARWRHGRHHRRDLRVQRGRAVPEIVEAVVFA